MKVVNKSVDEQKIPVQEPPIDLEVRGNGAAIPRTARVVVDNTASDQQTLDEFERLAADALIDDEDEDEPGASDEISELIVVKKLPRFANFMSNLVTFDLWGTPYDEGMDQLVYVTTRSFAPNFEEDVELKRVRFFETVTAKDGVVRLVYCFVPGKSERKPNSWTTSKLAALTLSQTRWTTMRSRTKLGQYTFRPARKDHGVPQFSGLTKQQFIFKLHQQGLLVVSKDHPFFVEATDGDE